MTLSQGDNLCLALSICLFVRHFIASLSDDLEYVERRVVVNMEGYNFQYIYHEITGGFFYSIRESFLHISLTQSVGS